MKSDVIHSKPHLPDLPCWVKRNVEDVCLFLVGEIDGCLDCFFLVMGFLVVFSFVCFRILFVMRGLRLMCGEVE